MIKEILEPESSVDCFLRRIPAPFVHVLVLVLVQSAVYNGTDEYEHEYERESVVTLGLWASEASPRWSLGLGH